MQRIVWVFIFVTMAGIFSSMPARAAPDCLKPTWDNTFAYWVNSCNFNVYVNWDDGADCHDYSCAASIAPLSKSPATINRNNTLQWCEFHNGNTGRCDKPGTQGAAVSPSSADLAQYGGCASDPAMRSELDRVYDDLKLSIESNTMAAIAGFIVYADGRASGDNWERLLRVYHACE